MPSRKLKVHPKYRPSSSSTLDAQGRTIPELRLAGVWLEECGFNVGAQVLLIISQDEITIKLLKDGDC